MLNYNLEMNVRKILKGISFKSEVILNDIQFFLICFRSFLFLVSCDQDLLQEKVSLNIVKVLGFVDVQKIENDLEEGVYVRLDVVF